MCSVWPESREGEVVRWDPTAGSHRTCIAVRLLLERGLPVVGHSAGRCVGQDPLKRIALH